MKTNSTPAPADDLPVDAAQASAAPAIHEEPINILIVDDEPKNLTVLETVLDDPSYRLVRAESAEQALLALVAEEFALLILDIQMPGMTGFELAHMIKDRKKTARIPIIFLTAYYNEDQHVLEGYGTGAVDYLHKPVNAAILRSKVAVFAELHRKSRESQQVNRTLLAEVTQRSRAEQQLRELNESLEQRVTERTEVLREREHFLQRMTDVSPSIIVVFNLEEERCVFINRTVAFVLGYSAEEIAAMGNNVVPMLMHPDDWARFPAHLQRVRALRDDETADFEHRMRDHAGEWHWFHSRDAVFARDAAGAVRQLIGTAIEITERKLAEEALRESEMEIKAARDYAEATLRTMPVPFIVLRADLRVNTASDAFYENFEVAPAATEGRLIYEIGNGQWNIPKLRELLEEIIPQKKVFNGFEVVHEFATIGKRTMMLNARRVDNAMGVPERILLAIQDITEGKLVEQKFRDLLESAPDAMIITSQAGQISLINTQTEKLFGYSRDELIGKPVEVLIPKGSRECHPGHRYDFLAAPKARPMGAGRELWALRKDGTEFPAEISLSPLETEEGFLVIAAIRDTTERQQAEEALRVAMTEIQRGSRAKDDFLAALSHELRTPLTPVLMMATDLAGDPSLPIEVRDQLAMMRRNIELEARLIDDLLDLTRIRSGKLAITPVPADIHQLIEYTAEIVRSDGLNKQVRIVFTLEATRHHALADPTRLQQVFWNLLKNALKFTPTGGSITVSTRNDAEDWIVVSVEDTGIGIGADALPNVFNAFEQGDIAGQHRYGGLGLGLAISQAIVAVHGGTITAASEGSGRGATFTVALATVAEPAVPAHASRPRPAPGRSLRLLIVEDHEATLSVLTRLLTRSGHRITTAGTMHEALTAFAAERFDAIISDLGLPDGSGLELMREIQRQRPVPGIALSGYGMEDDLRQTKEAGFFAHLVKPVNVDQLRLLLDQLTVPVG